MSTHMYEQLKKPVSIVMIAYNEAGHIEKVLEECWRDVFQLLPAESEFILYLDKPTDTTPAIVERVAPPRGILVIKGETNLGYRGAMMRALHAAKNDIVFYSDSSGKHRAADFWDLVTYEAKYDIVTGLRRFHNYSPVRRVVTFCQRILVSALFGIPFYDFNTGFKIVHRNIINNVLDECVHTKQSFSTELLVRAYAKGYTIKNVPVLFKDRTGKNTGTNLKMLPGVMMHSLKGLIQLRLELLRDKTA